MWVQPQAKIKEAPMAKTMLVNTRGRVVPVPNKEVKELTSKGFSPAPKDSIEGQYIKELDSEVIQPKAPEVQEAPVDETPKKKKRRRRRRKSK